MTADMIDLATVEIVNAPADVASWPATVAITALEIRPGKDGGLAFTFDPTIPDRWDFHIAGWGDLDRGGHDKGNVLFTVWAVALVGERWVASAFIQMWRGRESTGAPPLAQFAGDWAYSGRWGALHGYQPQVGAVMGFFVTAGNARDARSSTSVRERSNVVSVSLPAMDAGRFTFEGLPASPPSVPFPDRDEVPQLSSAELMHAVAVVSGQVEKIRLQDAETQRMVQAIYDKFVRGI